MSHTPGPWQLHAEGQAVHVESSDGRRMALCDDPRTSMEERLANARLIAAAPAMLEELRILAQSCQDALNGEWDYLQFGEDGFLAMLVAANEIIESAEASSPVLAAARPPSGPSRKELELPLLRALRELGGRVEVPSEELYRLVASYSAVPLADGDWDKIHARPKWVYTLQWTRYNLVKNGAMKQSKPGIWEISEQGTRRIGVE